MLGLSFTALGDLSPPPALCCGSILRVYSFPLHATCYHQLMLYSKIYMQTSATQFKSCLVKYDKISAGLKAIQILKHGIVESYSPPPLSNYSINKQHAEFWLRCSNHKRSDSRTNSLSYHIICSMSRFKF